MQVYNFGVPVHFEERQQRHSITYIQKIAPFVQSTFLVALVRKEEVTKEVN